MTASSSHLRRTFNPPFVEFTFEDVVDRVLSRFLFLLKQMDAEVPIDVPRGELYHVDYYRKTIVLAFPLKLTGRKPLYYVVAIHVSERQWYTSKKRVFDEERKKGHYYSACNAMHRFLKKKGGRVKERMVKDRTIILLGPTYTKSVKGAVARTYGKVMFACWVVKKVFELDLALIKIWKVVVRYLERRLKALLDKFEELKMRPFGEVEEFAERLKIIVGELTSWLDRASREYYRRRTLST